MRSMKSREALLIVFRNTNGLISVMKGLWGEKQYPNSTHTRARTYSGSNMDVKKGEEAKLQERRCKIMKQWKCY